MVMDAYCANCHQNVRPLRKSGVWPWLAGLLVLLVGSNRIDPMGLDGAASLVIIGAAIAVGLWVRDQIVVSICPICRTRDLTPGC